MPKEDLNNYIVRYNHKSVIDKIKTLAHIRYQGQFFNVLFISATQELAEHISKWNEVDSIEIEEVEVLFQ